MLLYTTLLILLTNVLAKKSKLCFNDNILPFSGYRIENQFNMQTFENKYSLLYCHEDRLISYTQFGKNIPWGEDIQFENANLILSRRKSFALREIPFYFPDNIVGSLNIIDDHAENIISYPLISDDILNNWLEVSSNLELIYHIPILSTPKLESRNFERTLDWNKFIDLRENYSFSYDPRTLIQIEIDLYLNTLNNLLPTDRSEMENVITKVIFISKIISTKLALKFIEKIDKMFTQDV